MVIVPIVLGVIMLLFRPLKLMSFDPVMASTMGLNVTVLHYLLMILLSATVVAALRSVGVIMAVAMLITPAGVGYQLTNRLQTMIVVAASAGALSALVGMFLAFQVDCPPGPAMVLVATGMFVAAMVFAPQRGILAERRRRRRVRSHIVEEDVLKALVRSFADMKASVDQLVGALTPITSVDVRRAVQHLEREGFVTHQQGQCVLTQPGRERAVGLVRAHRLWETYLAEQNIADPELHDMAERLEHAHELAGELDVILGHPKLDPHGELIPREGDASVSDPPSA